MYLPFDSCDQVASALLAASAPHAAPLWALCVADAHGDQVPALIDHCRAQGLRICGAIFPGLIVGEKVEKRGLIAIPLPGDSSVHLADLQRDGVQWRDEPAVLPEGPAASSLLFIDCLAPNITALLEDLYNRYGRRLTHYGAGTGYHDLRPAPSVFTEQGCFSNVALAVISTQRMTVRVRHGWTRVAGPFVASRTEGNVIKELNWEPAATLYRSEVVALDPAFAERPMFPDLMSVFPLCIAKEGGEDVMRDPIGQGDGDDIVVLTDVTENSVMYLARGDRETLIAAAVQGVDDCGAPGDVERCFISDCYSRVLMMGDAFEDELRAVSRQLRGFTDVTPEGVLALGEVANHGDQYLELFNKTFVVALTHR